MCSVPSPSKPIHPAIAASFFLMLMCWLLPQSALHAAFPLNGNPGGIPALRGKSLDSRPVCFTENRGQIVDTEGNPRPDILYTADVNGVRLYVRRTGISYVFSQRKEPEKMPDSQTNAFMSSKAETEVVLYRMDMDFAGGNPFAQARPGKVLDGVSHYYLAHCPDGIRDVRTFEGIVMEDIYPSIDMRIMTVDGKMKSEFIVHPGGNPADIRMEYTGATEMFDMPDGGMQVHAPLGYFEESTPVSWQEDGRGVNAEFSINGSTLTWDVEDYDAQKDLIIDPWGTYHGGSQVDHFYAVDCDGTGNIYVTGYTESSNFPVLAGVQNTYAGDADAILAKYSNGGQLLWSTYCGGSGEDVACAIAVGATGDMVVTGGTFSSNFPILNAWQAGLSGSQDVFLIKLNSTGQPVWSTYFGGSGNEGWYVEAGYLASPKGGVALDASGNTYIAGGTGSTDLPVVNAYQPTYGGGGDGYLAEFSPTGQLSWATYFGASGGENFYQCCVTPQNTIAVLGRGSDPGFPVHNPVQANFGGGQQDLTITEFTSGGTMLWSTYLGGTDADFPYEISSDSHGGLYIASITSSSNMPTVNAIQPTLAGPVDGYICKLAATSNPSGGRTIEWATYVGGSGRDGSTSIFPDSHGNTIITGSTGSSDYPLVNPVQSVKHGDYDGFLTIINSNLSVEYSSYWGGGSYNEGGYGIALDPNENIIIVGISNSPDFVEANTSQTTLGGDYDGIIVNFSAGGPVVLPPDPPTDLTATVLSPTRIQLDWKDNADNENRYVIDHKTPSTSWSPLETVAPNSETWTVADLSPDTEHSFRVKAANSQHESDWSNVATVTTGTFDPPANLTATGHSSEEVMLTWDDNTDGEEGYELEYRKPGDSWMSAGGAAADAEKAMLGGLEANTTYDFRIRAFAGNIATDYSNTAQGRTLLYLTAPTNLDGVLQSETHVALTWEDNADGESGYEVEHNEMDQGWVTIHTTDADATSYDAQALTPRTTNRFRVRAVGPNAASGYSNEYTIYTRMKPAPPQNLDATAEDHTSIRVTWERGSENEDGFEVERKAPGEDWTLLTTSGPGDGDILDENLEMTTIYWYRVRAENDLGYSDWSNEDSATTLDIPIPSAPFGLRAEAAGPTSITLNWVAPSPNYAESFEIEQSLTGDENDFSRVPPDADGKARTHTVTGLDPQTEYYFRIRAVNRSGASDYSNIASATTQGSDDPIRPRNLAARALSESQIEVTWEMPDPSNEDGFELQRSLTGSEGDFTSLSPAPGQGIRKYTDDGLAANTRYYYRLRSHNSFGESVWTDTVSATTLNGGISPELLAAMDAKEQIITEVEEIIPEGSQEMAALRSLLGDYPRGYDESAAEDLITRWRSEGTDNDATATEAMKRFTLFEKALRDSWGDEEATPPVTGVLDLGSQCGRIPAIASKDLMALSLAWKDERAFLGIDDPHVDAAMEDMILALSDNTWMLLALMGADRGTELPDLTSDILVGRGDVMDLSSNLMLSLLDYWREHMLGRYYFPATQPLIPAYADSTEQLAVTGTYAEAEGEKDAYETQLRADIDALTMDFSDYYRIGTSLDRAFAIGQTPGVDADVFLLRIKGLRPDLTNNMYAAITDAGIPTERFLYLTSPEPVKGLGSVPSALDYVGSNIFDPKLGGSPHQRNTPNVFQFMTTPQSTLEIDDDVAFLEELRAKVLEGDTEYISDQYDALRRSGKDMVADVNRLQRPLMGVDRAELYQDETLRSDYYYALARMQLLKTRRTVLSVALADYMLTPTAQKQTALVAEIDSIIGPLDGAIDDLANLVTDATSLITLPVLSLDNADIIRDEASGPDRCRIRFTVKNVGGAEASNTEAAIDVLTAGVTTVGDSEFSLGTLQTAASTRDSMDVEIPKDITQISISAVLESGDRSFIDRMTLPVPQSTTGIENAPLRPASCILHQNYPNPFRGHTTITYTIPQRSSVTLRVFDIFGREVQRVHRHAQMPGSYSIRVNSGDLRSGTYLYTLEANGAVLSRRMVVMR